MTNFEEELKKQEVIARALVDEAFMEYRPLLIQWAMGNATHSFVRDALLGLPYRIRRLREELESR